MPSVIALRRWLVFVALLRLLSGACRQLISIHSWLHFARSLRLPDLGAPAQQSGRHADTNMTPEVKTCPAVYLGIFEVKYFRTNLFDLHPESGMHQPDNVYAPAVFT